MAVKSLILNSTDTNSKELAKTIAFANPEATDAQCLQFGRALNGLTTNTFVGMQRLSIDDIVDVPEDEGE